MLYAVLSTITEAARPLGIGLLILIIVGLLGMILTLPTIEALGRTDPLSPLLLSVVGAKLQWGVWVTLAALVLMATGTVISTLMPAPLEDPLGSYPGWS